MRMVLTVLASLLLPFGAAFAQNTRGTITGSIADSAGALMPGVRIEARNTGTDTLYQVVSSSTGTYTLAQLPPGAYQISVSVPGFRPYTRTGITVLEAQVIRIDIVMMMLSSDEILTNDSVLQLLKAGIDEDLIISKIRDSQHSFDLSVQGMVALKEGGASDRLMHYLMDPAKPPEPKAAATPARPIIPPAAAAPRESPKAAEIPAAKSDPGFPKEIGVYVKADKQWIEIQPEAVVWQTGGTFKRFATAGIVQGDVNGRIKGVHSVTVVKVPLEFVIVAPEGVDIAEYQLIHLREQRDAREFRTVTGGVFSSSGGATRDAIPFENTKVLSRTFTVNLPMLDDGEYGFLPTGGALPGSSANVGKMFTFQVK
jgi:hypothetical protein